MKDEKYEKTIKCIGKKKLKPDAQNIDASGLKNSYYLR